jgi:phosphate transport system substrate-binding protein
MLHLKTIAARWAGVALGAATILGPAMAAEQSLPTGSQDSLELQRTRARFVQERGAKKFYSADKFDLSELPVYKPENKVSGVIRIWGNNYLADSGLATVWEEEFRKLQPGVKIEWNLHSAATAVGALWSGAADIGVTGRGVLWSERLAFQRQFDYDVTEIVSATGSYNVAGWTNALGIFVHKDNPITRLSYSQLDGIFGAAREGGWGKDFEWHRDVGRGSEKNLRTWGQLGLTGEWADKPIDPYGLNLRYEQSLRIADPILKGSDKWNENIKLFANFTDTNGKLVTAAQQVMEHLDNDRYGIGYGGVMNLTPDTKVIAVSINDSGPFVPLTLETVHDRTYPLVGDVYFYLNRKPGTALDPKLREFVRFILSREGQAAVARDGKYLPLTAGFLQQQRSKLD